MRKAALTLLGLAALTLAACGEVHGTGSVGTSSEQTKANHAVEQVRKETEEGFHNMRTLADSFKSTYNEKHSDVGKVDEAACIQTGKQSATCHWSGTETGGEHAEGSVEVTIAEDGQTWISK